MAKTLTAYVVRSKKTGWYFHFEQYCDDGWGNYEDNVHTIGSDDMPTLFSEGQIDNLKNLLPFRDHELDELEPVKVTFTIED